MRIFPLPNPPLLIDRSMMDCLDLMSQILYDTHQSAQQLPSAPSTPEQTTRKIASLIPEIEITERIIGHHHAAAAGIVDCGQGASVLVAGRCVADGGHTRRRCAGKCTASRIGCSHPHSGTDQLESPTAHKGTIPGANTVRAF